MTDGKPLIDPAIVRMVGRLEAVADATRALADQFQEAFDDARTLAQSGGRGRWVDVDLVSLTDRGRIAGELYFVRRVWRGAGRNSADDPCLAEWTPNGWKVRYGYLVPTTSAAASVEQWVFE